MTKDYAKTRSKLTPFTPKRHNRYQHPHSASTGLPSWAWMLFGLIFGMASSTFIFWKLKPAQTVPDSQAQIQDSQIDTQVPSSPKNKTAKKDTIVKMLNTVKTSKITNDSAELATLTLEGEASSQTEKSTATPTTTITATPETRFDFYTLLPTINIDSPDKGNTQAVTQHAIPYIIQAGSFKNADQAEQLKATLALQGLEARLQTVTVNPAESWYRVYIGPFHTKAEALQAQQALEGLGGADGQSLDSVILKMRV